MIAGAAFARFVFSSGGVIVAVTLLLVWSLARPRSRAARISFVAVVVAYLLASSYPLPHAIALRLSRSFQPLRRDQAPSGAATAIVLLGSGAFTPRAWTGESFSVLDRHGAERALEAARLYHLLGPRWVISSGGRVVDSDPDLPSGVVMKEALVLLGVPADRIVVEEKSRTTREEATIVKNLLPSLGVQHVVLVTSAVHMRRSAGVFRSVGIDAIPAIAYESPHEGNGKWLSWLPSEDGLEESQDVSHEILGLAYYWIRGWQ